MYVLLISTYHFFSFCKISNIFKNIKKTKYKYALNFILTVPKKNLIFYIKKYHVDIDKNYIRIKFKKR